MFRQTPDQADTAGGAAPAHDYGGWVMFYRSLAQHELWLMERFTRGQAWADLLLLAAHRDHICTTGNVATPVGRGQVLTSQMKLAERWRWNRETVARFLKLLRTLEMASIETSKRTDTGYTLITLLNYERLQRRSAADPASAPASDPASGRHRAGIGQALSRMERRDKKGKKEDQPQPSDGAGADAPEAVEVSTTTEQPAKWEPEWGTPEALVALYHDLIPAGHPRVTLLSPARSARAKDYLKKFPGREFWATAFGMVAKSRFLRGQVLTQDRRPFRADLDWFLQKGKDGTENCVKAFEGKYLDEAPAENERPLMWRCDACGKCHSTSKALKGVCQKAEEAAAVAARAKVVPLQQLREPA